MIYLIPWEAMQTEMVIRNPDASMPLRVNVDVVCNTSDEKILANIQNNSVIHCKDWLKIEDAHEGVALLCGSGASLADCLDDIKYFAASGAKVFALNGSANYLVSQGIIPDYQVILDAQPHTASLFCPDARKHLFASQVDPILFMLNPRAILWQVTHGEIAPEFPFYEADYCVIGGAISVGNAAPVVAYSMGYRTLHLFGYDTSYREGKGHAFNQPLNEFDPVTIVNFNGKEYICSLTMKLQAEYFMPRARELQRLGCHIEMYGDGLLPDMFNIAPISEKEKYERIWKMRNYGDISPGARNAEFFVEKFKPHGRVTDFGCGSGKGAKRIAELTDCNVVMIDIAGNAVDADNHLSFFEMNMSERISFVAYADYGFCCDVMEHIPRELVNQTIKNIMDTAPKVFFQISTVDDVWGSTIGHSLHLTVENRQWWQSTFESLGFTVEWSDESELEAYFFITNSLESKNDSK